MKCKISTHMIIAGATLIVGSIGMSAQDYIYNTFQFAHKDYPMPPACELNLGIKSSHPFVFDEDAWVLYTCNDDYQFSRRFFSHHPISTATPVPMTLPILDCSQWNLYPSKQGGCVDFYHPDRKK